MPPGRARLAARLAATGSAPSAITIGIVEVARVAAIAPAIACVRIASTLSATNSAAMSRSRSGLPSAQRYSMARFLPST
jgi:hypothetical protein